MKIKTLILFIILLIAILVSIGGYIEIKKNQMEEAVEEYLLEDKGYERQEIKSIEGLFSILPVWSVRVVFKDEDNMNYYYQIESNKVEQTREYPTKNADESFLNNFIEGNVTPKHHENK